MKTPLSIIRDINNFPTTGEKTGLVFSTLNEYFILTQNVVTTVTVPTGGSRNYLAYISYTPGYNVWVLPSDTPTLTLPTTTPTATLAQLNPAARLVTPGQTLQFLTGDTILDILSVSISYYYLYSNSGVGLE